MLSIKWRELSKDENITLNMLSRSRSRDVSFICELPSYISRMILLPLQSRPHASAPRNLVYTNNGVRSKLVVGNSSEHSQETAFSLWKMNLIVRHWNKSLLSCTECISFRFFHDASCAFEDILQCRDWCAPHVYCYACEVLMFSGCKHLVCDWTAVSTLHLQIMWQW
jgi:hypothetical protein